MATCLVSSLALTGIVVGIVGGLMVVAANGEQREAATTTTTTTTATTETTTATRMGRREKVVSYGLIISLDLLLQLMLLAFRGRRFVDFGATAAAATVGVATATRWRLIDGGQ